MTLILGANMPWNYRVIHTRIEPDPILQNSDLYDIKEVYYDKDGSVLGYSEASVTEWDTLDNLKGTLKLMMKAFDRPVLEAFTPTIVPKELSVKYCVHEFIEGACPHCAQNGLVAKLDKAPGS